MPDVYRRYLDGVSEVCWSGQFQVAARSTHVFGCACQMTGALGGTKDPTEKEISLGAHRRVHRADPHDFRLAELAGDVLRDRGMRRRAYAQHP